MLLVEAAFAMIAFRLRKSLPLLQFVEVLVRDIGILGRDPVQVEDLGCKSINFGKFMDC